jgi:hypothetical protein
MVKRPKVLLVIVASVAFWVLGMFFYMTRHPIATKNEVGIAVIDGQAVVVSCKPGGIGKVEISSGSIRSRSSWHAVWTATVLVEATPSATVPIREEVAGYAIESGTVPGPVEPLIVTSMNRGDGVALIQSVFGFVEADIPEGFIRTGGGETVPLGEYRAQMGECQF